MLAFIASQRAWLVERLPAYAPDLNPVEGLWSNLKQVELANLTFPTLGGVRAHDTRPVMRIRSSQAMPHFPHPTGAAGRR
jgi:hypothetical protein